MTEIVVSPTLPKWVLETYEGQLLAHWIGYSESGDQIEFSGDTENEDDEGMIPLDLTSEEVLALADIAEKSGAPLGLELSRVLRDPEGAEVMNDYLGKIDITAMRCVLEQKNENADGMRSLEVDDFLASLVSRFPSEIPFAEVTWARGATLVTPAGVEWFKKAGERDARKEEYEASLGAMASPA